MASISVNGPLRVMSALFALLSLLPALRCAEEVDYNKDGADIGTVEMKPYDPSLTKGIMVHVDYDIAVHQTDTYSGHVILCKNGSAEWNKFFPLPDVECKDGYRRAAWFKFTCVDQMWYALAVRPKSDPSKCIYSTKPIFVDIDGKIDPSKLVYPPQPKDKLPQYIAPGVIYMAFFVNICILVGVIIFIAIIVMLIKRFCMK
ncbi:hypothetical protein PAPHI01_1406 [Pancytospora philotis]|nr:hypothetical protein PAPHI01_1406 [Pancytospora philotis]